MNMIELINQEGAPVRVDNCNLDLGVNLLHHHSPRDEDHRGFIWFYCEHRYRNSVQKLPSSQAAGMDYDNPVNNPNHRRLVQN